MVRSRGKPIETEEEPIPTQESVEESEEIVNDEVVAKKKQTNWEFSDARKANLAKARAKATLLREQLKIANPPPHEPKAKAKAPTKLEKQLQELKLKNEKQTAESSSPTNVESETKAESAEQRNESSDVTDASAMIHQKVSEAPQPRETAPKSEFQSKILRKGKLVYLLDWFICCTILKREYGGHLSTYQFEGSYVPRNELIQYDRPTIRTHSKCSFL